jgi:hypothetical protein
MVLCALPLVMALTAACEGEAAYVVQNDGDTPIVARLSGDDLRAVQSGGSGLRVRTPVYRVVEVPPHTTAILMMMYPGMNVSMRELELLHEDCSPLVTFYDVPGYGTGDYFTVRRDGADQSNGGIPNGTPAPASTLCHAPIGSPLP